MNRHSNETYFRLTGNLEHDPLLSSTETSSKLEVGILSNLEIVALDKFNALTHCVNIRKLDLSSNTIALLPASTFWQSFPNLEILHLHHNRVSREDLIPNLSPLINLKYLTLFHNPISRSQNYRRCIARAIPSLLALDNFLVADGERLEGLTHYSEIFSPLTEFLSIPYPHELAESIGGESDPLSLFHGELRLVRLLASQMSPACCIQRTWRGYRTRKMLHEEKTKLEILLAMSRPKPLQRFRLVVRDVIRRMSSIRRFLEKQKSLTLYFYLREIAFIRSSIKTHNHTLLRGVEPGGGGDSDSGASTRRSSLSSNASSSYSHHHNHHSSFGVLHTSGVSNALAGVGVGLGINRSNGLSTSGGGVVVGSPRGGDIGGILTSNRSENGDDEFEEETTIQLMPSNIFAIRSGSGTEERRHYALKVAKSAIVLKKFNFPVAPKDMPSNEQPLLIMQGKHEYQCMMELAFGSFAELTRFLFHLRVVNPPLTNTGQPVHAYLESDIKRLCAAVLIQCAWRRFKVHQRFSQVVQSMATATEYLAAHGVTPRHIQHLEGVSSGDIVAAPLRHLRLNMETPSDMSDELSSTVPSSATTTPNLSSRIWRVSSAGTARDHFLGHLLHSTNFNQTSLGSQVDEIQVQAPRDSGSPTPPFSANAFPTAGSGGSSSGRRQLGQYGKVGSSSTAEQQQQQGKRKSSILAPFVPPTGSVEASNLSKQSATVTTTSFSSIIAQRRSSPPSPVDFARQQRESGGASPDLLKQQQQSSTAKNLKIKLPAVPLATQSSSNNVSDVLLTGRSYGSSGSVMGSARGASKSQVLHSKNSTQGLMIEPRPQPDLDDDGDDINETGLDERNEKPITGRQETLIITEFVKERKAAEIREAQRRVINSRLHPYTSENMAQSRIQYLAQYGTNTHPTRQPALAGSPPSPPVLAAIGQSKKLSFIGKPPQNPKNGSSSESEEEEDELVLFSDRKLLKPIGGPERGSPSIMSDPSRQLSPPATVTQSPPLPPLAPSPQSRSTPIPTTTIISQQQPLLLSTSVADFNFNTSFAEFESSHMQTKFQQPKRAVQSAPPVSITTTAPTPKHDDGKHSSSPHHEKKIKSANAAVRGSRKIHSTKDDDQQQKKPQENVANPDRPWSTHSSQSASMFRIYASKNKSQKMSTEVGIEPTNTTSDPSSSTFLTDVSEPTNKRHHSAAPPPTPAPSLKDRMQPLPLARLVRPQTFDPMDMGIAPHPKSSLRAAAGTSAPGIGGGGAKASSQKGSPDRKSEADFAVGVDPRPASSLSGSSDTQLDPQPFEGYSYVWGDWRHFETLYEAPPSEYTRRHSARSRLISAKSRQSGPPSIFGGKSSPPIGSRSIGGAGLISSSSPTLKLPLNKLTEHSGWDTGDDVSSDGEGSMNSEDNVVYYFPSTSVVGTSRQSGRPLTCRDTRSRDITDTLIGMHRQSAEEREARMLFLKEQRLASKGRVLQLLERQKLNRAESKKMDKESFKRVLWLQKHAKDVQHEEAKVARSQSFQQARAKKQEIEFAKNFGAQQSVFSKRFTLRQILQKRMEQEAEQRKLVQSRKEDEKMGSARGGIVVGDRPPSGRPLSASQQCSSRSEGTANTHMRIDMETIKRQDNFDKSFAAQELVALTRRSQLSSSGASHRSSSGGVLNSARRPHPPPPSQPPMAESRPGAYSSFTHPSVPPLSNLGKTTSGGARSSSMATPGSRGSGSGRHYGSARPYDVVLQSAISARSEGATESSIGGGHSSRMSTARTVTGAEPSNSNGGTNTTTESEFWSFGEKKGAGGNKPATAGSAGKGNSRPSSASAPLRRGRSDPIAFQGGGGPVGQRPGSANSVAKKLKAVEPLLPSAVDLRDQHSQSPTSWA